MIKLIILLPLLLLLALPLFFAYGKIETLPCRSPQEGECARINNLAAASTRGLEFLGIGEGATPGDIFEALYKFALSLVGVSAMIMIVLGGIMYMTAGDSKSRTDQGKGYITNAIWGLIIALVSWLILYTINPDLVGKLNLNLAPINLQTPNLNNIPQGGLRPTTPEERTRLQTDVAGSRQQLGNFTIDEFSATPENRQQLQQFQSQCISRGGQTRSTVERIGSTIRLYTCTK